METNASEPGPSTATQTQPPDSEQTQNEGESETGVTLHKIQVLLKTKDDTSRFVGLALLKSVLDNSQQLREDEATITTLWQSVSPKFLDRLLRSGTKNAKDMVDIAVAVIHTFSALLPEDARKGSRLVDRLPALVSVVLDR